MKGIVHDAVPIITYFSGPCRAGPQQVLILDLAQPARPPILLRLLKSIGRSIRSWAKWRE